jgi:hypothetical protein
MSTRQNSRPYLTAVSSQRRRTEREAEEAALELVRGMGEGDIFEGLGKLQMLQALDSMRCDWLEVLDANLPGRRPRPSDGPKRANLKKGDV